MPDIYFRRPEKSEHGKNAKLKKLSRVFKNKHACCYCTKMVCKPVEHLEGHHSNEEDVQEIISLSKDDAQWKTGLTILRNKGNHKHNLSFLSAKRGEMLLSRRPSRKTAAPLFVSVYTPCPSCFVWVTDLVKHRSHTDRCVASESRMSKGGAVIASSTKVGRLTGASDALKREVLAKMADNAVARIMSGDSLTRK